MELHGLGRTSPQSQPSSHDRGDPVYCILTYSIQEEYLHKFRTTTYSKDKSYPTE